MRGPKDYSHVLAQYRVTGHHTQVMRYNNHHHHHHRSGEEQAIKKTQLE